MSYYYQNKDDFKNISNDAKRTKKQVITIYESITTMTTAMVI